MESNHPPNILTNIPESINNRLSSISSNENVFNETSPPYQEALNKSGYNYQLKFKETPSSNTKNPSGNNRRNRSRKKQITWFNPPYSRNVKNKHWKKVSPLNRQMLSQRPQTAPHPKQKHCQNKLLMYAQYEKHYLTAQ